MSKIKTISSAGDENPGKHTRLLLIIIASFSFILYLNTIPNGYNLDDELVTKNHAVTSKGIKGIPEIFTSPYYKDAAGNAYEYRPVTLTSFALEHQVFGDNVHVSHFVNALLYVLLSALLFITLLKLFRDYNYIPAFVITLLFIAHPIHTEAVASIKNRDELLCFTGGILAFYYSLVWFETGKIKFWLLFIFFFLFAVLSKKSILPFSLVIPLGHLFFSRSKPAGIAMISLPLAAVSAVFYPSEDIVQKIGVGLFLFSIPMVSYLVFEQACFKTLWTDAKSSVQDLKAKGRAFVLPQVDSILLKLFFIALGITLALVLTYYDLKILIVIYVIFIVFLHSFSEEGNRTWHFYNILIFISIVGYFYTVGELIPVLFAAGLSKLITGQQDRLKNLVPLALMLIYPFILRGWDVPATFINIGFILLFSFLFFKMKRQGLTLIIVLITSVIIFILSFAYSADKFAEVSWFPAVLAFIYFKQDYVRGRFSVFFVIALVPLLVINIVSERNKMPASLVFYETQNIITEARNNVNGITVIPASGRELNYIEMPLKHSDPLDVRIGTSFIVLGKYLQLLTIPHHLGFYYGYAYIEPVPWNNTGSLLSMLIYGLLLASAFYFLKKHPVYSYGIFFYFVCISAFSNLTAPVAGVMADRLAFVASAGFCISLAYILVVFAGLDIKSPNVRLNFANKKLLLIAAILLVYSVKTFSRNLLWKDHVTLMRHDAKYLDRSVQANNLLGVHLVERSFELKKPAEKEKYLKEAVIHFRKAVDLYPMADFAWHDLGQTYLLLDNKADALPAFLKAIEIDSTYRNALMKTAQIYTDQKKYPLAEFYFGKWLKVDSNSLPPYTSLSQAYFMQKKYAESIKINELAVKRFPSTYDPVVNIGKTYFTMGDKKNALVYFEKAYTLNPNDKNLLVTMAGIYKELGENEKADFYFSKANQIR